MKKRILYSGATAILALLFLAAFGGPANASDYGHSGSPEFLYYMEGTGAYFLPDSEVDIFFSLGNWYRRSSNSWSTSVSLSGPWGAISVSNAPSVLVNLPLDFRATLNHGRVPYRYVVDQRSGQDDYGPRYYSGRYYDDHDRRGYQRRRHSSGGFWFFIAPGLHFDDRDDHRDWDDDRDDDSHGRRGRGRGRGRD